MSNDAKLPREVVLFRSDAFNTTEERDYFINPCCFGDDVARWFIEELQKRNIVVDAEPSQEDWGWYFFFTCENSQYTLKIGFRPEDDDRDDWLCFIEPPPRPFLSWLKRENKTIHPCAARTIHDVLSQSDKISHIRWLYKERFDTLDESDMASQPFD